MRLIGHIALKDLRRVALPASVWLAFFTLCGWRFGLQRVPLEAVRAGSAEWLMQLGGFATWVGIMRSVTSVLLAGVLLLQDPAVGTTSCWQTRPISPWRMLAAKFLAGSALLVLAPTSLLLPLWVASGWTAGEVALAAGELMAIQWALLATGFGVAALVETLGRFLLTAVGLAFGYVLVSVPFYSLTGVPGPNLERTRQLLLPALAVLGLAAMAVQQYAGRPRRGWWIAIGGLLALHAVRVAWPLNLERAMPTAWRWGSADAVRAEDRAVAIAFTSLDSPGDPHARRLTVTAGSGREPDAMYAVTGGTGELRWPNRPPARFAFTRGDVRSWSDWARLAALEVASGQHASRSTAWLLHDAAGSAAATLAGAPTSRPDFVGEVVVERVRGRVLARLPITAGAEGGIGGSRVRIVDSALDPDGTPWLVLEERDPLFTTASTIIWSRPHDEARWDCYLLVDHPGATGQLLRREDVGWAALDSLRFGVVRLKPPADGPGLWPAGAELVKVRFEIEHRFRRAVSLANVPVTSGRDSP